MSLRRIAVIALSMVMVCASIPAPASAGLSTGTEIQIGKDYDKQITDSTNVVTDPLITKWVNDISAKLWAQAARKDVPYQIKILDVPDLNAFSTLGGYVYLNLGILDFVQSDDELASVIGHETGHIERRHAITSNNKAGLINLGLSILSLFSPFVWRFGQLIQAGALAKVSRDDETQADRYGLLLMTRAGYDPNSMVTFMQHMQAVLHENKDVLSKYLADHPDFQNRVAHLVGYPELDPKVRTDDARLAAAIHDEDTGRYAIAARGFADYLTRHPGDASAEVRLGDAQIALGQTAKSEQHLSSAIATGTPETKALAQARIRYLRDAERKLSLLHPDLAPLREELKAARDREAQTATAVGPRREAGLQQIKGVINREQSIVYEIPPWVGRIQPRAGSRSEAVLKNLTIMGRSLDAATNKENAVLSGVGTMQRNKEGGSLKESSDILAEMAAPLDAASVPPQSLATLASYPAMLAEMSAVDADTVRSLDAARGALALTDVALGDLDAFIRSLARAGFDGMGEISMYDYKQLEPQMATAIASLDKAALASSQALQLFDGVRARQLQVRIDTLGLGSSEARYATLQRALDGRFALHAPAYDEMLRAGMTPGQVAAATVVAADTNTTPQAVIAEARASHRSIVDTANARGMLSTSLEIFMDLVYMDYADDPDKEARGRS